jgi:S-DNA-T family DNA segregation ATPase FtsK/SpoIIIE
MPDEAVQIAPPPAVLEPEGSRWLTTVLPALSSLGIVGFAIVSGSLLYIALGVGLSAVGVAAAIAARAGTTRSRRRRQEGLRRRYGEHLDGRHRQLRDLAERQRRGLHRVHPDPEDWGAVLAGTRLWERRPWDADFLTVRLGLGRAPLGVPIRLEPAAPATDEEEDLRCEAELLIAWHSHLDDVPIALDLKVATSAILSGPLERIRPLLRAMLVSLALTHAPGEVRLVTLLDADESHWAAQLPHVLAAVASVRELETVLGRVLGPTTTQRSPSTSEAVPLVVVVDAGLLVYEAGGADVLDRLVAAADEGLRLLVLSSAIVGPPDAARALISVDVDGCLVLRFSDGRPSTALARPDALDIATAGEVAAELARWRCPSAGAGWQAGAVLLSDLLAEMPRPSGHRLAVPIGRDLRGHPVELDLAEAAEGGNGPHGLIVGATGSGKSELLRALVAGLVTHLSPAEIALVCWDFKGGAAIAPFIDLPHVRGTVTNLEAEPRLVERAGRALLAEVRRRQRVLRDADVDGIAGYRKRQSDIPGELGPLPTLVLVVDEFTELLAAAPDLLELFLTIGRLGRSLGIHLVLASQRFDEGRLRGLESHLRFRVCLRTFSAADSHAVLGTAAAFHLPSTPGSGLFSVDGHEVRFEGAYPDDLARIVEQAGERWRNIVAPGDDVWPPALPAALPLDALLAGWRPRPLSAPVGLVDRPDEQRQDLLVADLTAGHLAVVGGPRTGRTTLLRTVIVSLAAATPPEALHVYAVDGGGGSLYGLAALPHVGAVCGIDDEDQVRQLLAMLVDLAARRRRQAPAAEGRPADVVLVLDGWGRFRQVYDDLTAAVAELAATGPQVGIRLVMTSSAWTEFRAGLREYLVSRWELRLGDPYESEHGKVRASGIPHDRPGRLLTPDGDEAQVATAGTALIATIASRGGRAAPPLLPLPARISIKELGETDKPVLGLGGPGADPVPLDVPGGDQHLLVVGDSGSGRSTTLRTLLTQLPTTDADLWIVDPRRSLLAFAELAAGYAYTGPGSGRLLDVLASRLRARLPAEGLTPWELLAGVPPGRAQILVIDDYDLIGGSSPGGFGGPLSPLVDLLAHSREIGLSLVIARRGGSAIRGGFDPGLQLLADLGVPAVLLSGDPSDGPVVAGVRPRPLPPGRGFLVRRGRSPVLLQVAEPGASTLAFRRRMNLANT